MDYLCSVKNLTKNENMTVALYFFRLCRNTIDEREILLQDTECMQSLYCALVSALGLKEHSKKVVAAFIKKHISDKLLTPDDMPDKESDNLNDEGRPSPRRKGRGRVPGRFTTDYVFSYGYQGQMEQWYREDPRIARFCDRWDSKTTDSVDFCRAVFAGPIFENLAKIIACTFFCKPDTKTDFSIPAEIKIPAGVIRLTEKTGKVQFMADAFKLTGDEKKLLNTVFLATGITELASVIESLTKNWDNYKIYSACSGISEKTIRSMLRRDSKLISYDILDSEGGLDRDAADAIWAGDLNALFCDILKKDEKKETFDLNSFAVKKEETELMLRLLNNKKGANILLYGSAGAGKTEYARALVKQAGFTPFIFKNDTELSSAKNPELYALRRLHCLMSIQKNDSVIIVDEAENLLTTGINPHFLFFGEFGSALKKGTVNTMLEKGNNRVIWIMNHTGGMDESTLRRFTYSLRFMDMSPAMLRRIAEGRLSELSMKPELKTEVADLFQQYRVTGASVDNMVKILEGMNTDVMQDAEIIRDVKSVLDANSSLLHGKKTVRDKTGSSYDLSVLNSSVPAENIVKMVQNAQAFAAKNGTEDAGIRILFYGASGTGKTELARYIAEKLHMEICFKRVSDIISMYVGKTEKNIAAAFAEASAKGEVLLFDEADSFFADRNSAERSWERTQVNEFLTQMEEFKGILICTTNLRKIMDPAMQRRFHIMAEFLPLKKEGIEKLLSRFFPAYSFAPETLARIAAYSTVTPGDFGSLSGKIRFMDPENLTAETITDELCAIQKEKNSGKERKMGFGE